MILEPGTFRVADRRKNIPDRIKLAVMIRQKNCAPDGRPFAAEDALTGNIRFDHRPPLENRRFDTVADDFIPPQLDPEKIEALRSTTHDQRTFGRKEGANRVVTTRGSDHGEAARARNISDTEAIHRAAMASKAGDYKGAARILSTVKKKSRLRPRRKIPTNGRPIPSRPFPSRKKHEEKRHHT